MSKKDYIEVAEMLKAENKTTRSAVVEDHLRNVARELALIFKRDNPRFRAGTFFDAAGFPELTASRMGLN